MDLHVAAELVDVALDHVHADAAAGHVADHVGGGEAGREDQVEDASSDSSSSGADQAALARLGEDPVALEAAAVVADLDHDVAALVIGVELDDAVRGLAGGQAHVRRLDAVVDGSCAPGAPADRRSSRARSCRARCSSPLRRSSTFLPSCWPRSRTRRGKRLNTKLMGNMRTRMTLSCSSRMWRSSWPSALRNSSASRPSSGAASWLSTDCVITSSPTEFSSSSIFSMLTRIEPPSHAGRGMLSAWTPRLGGR